MGLFVSLSRHGCFFQGTCFQYFDVIDRPVAIVSLNEAHSMNDAHSGRHATEDGVLFVQPLGIGEWRVGGGERSFN